MSARTFCCDNSNLISRQAPVIYCTCYFPHKQAQYLCLHKQDWWTDMNANVFLPWSQRLRVRTPLPDVLPAAAARLRGAANPVLACLSNSSISSNPVAPTDSEAPNPGTCVKDLAGHQRELSGRRGWTAANPRGKWTNGATCRRKRARMRKRCLPRLRDNVKGRASAHFFEWLTRNIQAVITSS